MLARLGVLRPWGNLSGLSVCLLLGLTGGIATVLVAISLPLIRGTLSYSRPERLVFIRSDVGRAVGRMPSLEEWRSRSELFVSLVAFYPRGSVRFKNPHGDLLLSCVTASPGFVATLQSEGTPVRGVGARDAGVLFLVRQSAGPIGSETQGGPDESYTLSSGETVRVASTPFDGNFPSRLWDPPQAIVELPSADAGRDVVVAEGLIGRLVSGVTPAEVAARLTATLPRGASVRVDPLGEYLSESVRQEAMGALAGWCLLLGLTLGATSISMFARLSERRTEFKLRQQLGATRASIASLLGRELVAPCALSALIALICAQLMLSQSYRILPRRYAVLGQPELDVMSGLASVAATAGVLAVACVAASIAAGIWRRRSHPAPAWLRVSGRRTFFAVIAAQNAFATVLLNCGVILAWSYVTVLSQPTGMNGAALILPTSYPSEQSPERVALDIDRTLELVRQLPQVSRVAAVFGLDGGLTGPARIDGRAVSVAVKFVSTDYIGAIGATLLAGRWLSPRDAGNDVVVTESFARKWWAGQSPIGKIVVFPEGAATVVGLIADQRDLGLERRAAPMAFLPLKAPWPCSQNCDGPAIFFIVRSEAGADVPVSGAVAAVRAANPRAIVSGEGLQRSRLLASVKPRLFRTLAVGVFALGALAIAAVSSLALVTVVARRRAHEMAVRYALGATHGTIALTYLSDSFIAAVVGVCVGTPVAHFVGRALSGLSAGISPNSLGSAGVAAALLVACNLLSALPPVLRSFRVPFYARLRQSGAMW